jgi:diaminopimelate decarboxylase
MNRIIQGSKDPDILAVDAALRRAARRARELGRKTGTPVYVIKNGRIVDLTKEWKQQSRAR